MADVLRPARPRRPLAAWGTLLGVGLGWGASQYLSKVATSTGLAAPGLALWGALIGAACFGTALAFRGGRLPLDRRHLVFFAVCGLVGTALPGCLSYTSIRHLPVGIQSIVLSTVPMMTLLLALAVGAERFDRRRVAGVGLGLVAMLMIALPESSLPRPEQVPWLALPVIVSASYAAENVFIDRAKPRDTRALQVMCGLSVAASLLLLPVVVLTGTFFWPWPVGAAEAALAGVSLLHVGAYFGFVWLIGHAGPVFAAQVAYVVTGSAILFGMVLLGERHGPWVWAALAVLFAGLALVRPRGVEPETGGRA